MRSDAFSFTYKVLLSNEPCMGQTLPFVCGRNCRHPTHIALIPPGRTERCSPKRQPSSAKGVFLAAGAPWALAQSKAGVRRVNAFRSGPWPAMARTLVGKMPRQDALGGGLQLTWCWLPAFFFLSYSLPCIHVPWDHLPNQLIESLSQGEPETESPCHRSGLFPGPTHPRLGSGALLGRAKLLENRGF